MASYRYLGAGLLTLAAGAVMAVGGLLFHDDGWRVAGPSMTPAGVLISIALMLAVRPATSQRDGLPVRSPWGRWARVIAALATGLPMAGGVPIAAQVTTTVLSVFAGALMAMAGYAAVAWSLWLVPPLVIASGIVISGSFAATLIPARRSIASQWARGT